MESTLPVDLQPNKGYNPDIEYENAKNFSSGGNPAQNEPLTDNLIPAFIRLDFPSHNHAWESYRTLSTAFSTLKKAPFEVTWSRTRWYYVVEHKTKTKVNNWGTMRESKHETSNDVIFQTE